MSSIHGTCLAVDRRVLTVTPREDGRTLVTVDPRCTVGIDLGMNHR